MVLYAATRKKLGNSYCCFWRRKKAINKHCWKVACFCLYLYYTFTLFLISFEHLAFRGSLKSWKIAFHFLSSSVFGNDWRVFWPLPGWDLTLHLFPPPRWEIGMPPSESGKQCALLDHIALCETEFEECIFPFRSRPMVLVFPDTKNIFFSVFEFFPSFFSCGNPSFVAPTHTSFSPPPPILKHFHTSLSLSLFPSLSLPPFPFLSILSNSHPSLETWFGTRFSNCYCFFSKTKK